MQWWDIYVQVPEPMEEVVSAYLQYLGSTGVVIYDGVHLSAAGMARLEAGAPAAGWTVLYGALPADATLPVRVCALQQFLDTSTASSLHPRWKLWCRPLLDVAYLTQWQRFFRPLNVAQRLVIHPPWETTSVSPEMASLVLDPGLAFGTGLHPTTHQCLTLLSQCITPGRGGRLLDVGCGSGILSLAALKLGANRAVGVDIDAQAVDVARRNARLNSLQEHVQFLEGTVDMVTGQFTWIAANIYLGPLVNMMPAFARRLAPQGSVILSGILEQQEAALQASLHAAGLNVQRRLAAEGWVALEGRHTSAVLERPIES